VTYRAAFVPALAVAAACGTPVPRFPPEVHAALADHDMRRLETDSLLLYYPAARGDEARRFADRAEGCIAELKARARLRNAFWQDKVVIVMPEMPFNNAFVAPPALGSEEISIVPTFNTLDFVTEFGLPPDPGHIACHEITHYVQHQQIAGLWGFLDRTFGDLLSPQLGFDSWFVEGLATHYEAALQPGAGRPRWPIFRGMFHAGYADERIGGGDLSELGRRAPPGHNYLVGTFFIDFLAERYGEEALWRVIEDQATSLLIFTGLNSKFSSVYGKSLSTLIDEFAAWTAERYPPRPTPPAQRRLHVLGADARYARGPRGDEAAVWNDVDLPTRLTVWAPDGRERATVPLIDLVPPRQLVMAAPILTSGLGVTADGTVYLTAVDLSTTQQTTRLLRWNGDLDELATDLGPGAAVDPAGRTYYYLAVDGDRWQLAAYDLATGARRIVTPAAAGQYVVGAQVSPDGKRLIASVWDKGFVLWIVDAASGARVSEIRTPDRSPVYDGAFVDDHTVTHLAVVDGRFQVAVRDLDSGITRTATDAPYAVLHGRPGNGTVRFLNRQGWRWTIDEVALPPSPPPPPSPSPPPPPSPSPSPSEAPPTVEVPAAVAHVAAPPPAGGVAVAAGNSADTVSLSLAGPRAEPATRAATVRADEPYSQLDHLFIPQLHTIAFAAAGNYAILGGALGGGDRLGFHRWAIAAFWQPDTDLISPQVGYINSNLAPWTFAVTALARNWLESEPMAAKEPRYQVRRAQRFAAASFGRTWRGILATAIDAVAVEERARVIPGTDPVPPVAPPDRRMLGAGASVAYAALESTRITGAIRGWDLSLGATYYPDRLSSLDFALTDVRGSLGLYAPLPFTRRHALSLVARGRGLVARGSTDLLELGGFSTLAVLWDGRRANRPLPPTTHDDDGLPAGIDFQEPLRGYEDYPIYTDGAAIADASWRYPIVIDRGTATFLWYLPASFLREIDLELFASAAVDDRGKDGLHGAAGAALSVHFAFFRIPLVVAAQASRRLFDDRALTSVIGFGVDL